MSTAFGFDTCRLDALCERWRIRELALFGSAARGELRPESDVDVLVTFAAGEHWSLFDLVRLRSELESLFGRPVDLVERDSIRNPFRRKAILDSLEILRAA
jgi:predicted nucleotidyltransferase